MRTFFTLTAAAPLVLLAACGETTPADESRVAPVDTEIAALDQSEAEPLPQVATSLDDVEFGGAYSLESPDGQSERLTLNSQDDTYEYTAANGTVTRGSYTRMDDNRRLSIEDFGGRPAYFAVADGELVRLENADTPADQITVASQRYRRDEAASAQETGPGATTDNVADPGN